MSSVTDRFWERWTRPSKAPTAMLDLQDLTRAEYRRIYTQARMNHEPISIGFLDSLHTEFIKRKLKGA